MLVVVLVGCGVGDIYVHLSSTWASWIFPICFIMRATLAQSPSYCGDYNSSFR